MTVVGKNIPRMDGVPKVTGKALYVDDISLPGMWFGAVVRSTIPHGRVKKVVFDPSFDWNQVVVADSKDIPGKNCVAMIQQDVPLIVCDQIKHIGEAVLLIAAPTKALAATAKNFITVSYEEQEPILSVEDSKKAKILIHGDKNIISEYKMSTGDVVLGFKQADEIIECVYTMGHQEHMYIEPNGIIASPASGGGIAIVGSIQCPYYISKAVSILMDIPEEKNSVRQATVGGAFGGKEDYPSILAGYASVLAKKAGRPVKIIYERAEDTEVTTKRHPAFVRHKTGVKKDGTLTAMEIEVEMDAGAYVTLTPVVLSRGFLHSTGAYRCQNIKACAIAYATNTPPNGAFRGFGAPQTIFPVEAHMDRVAKAIKMSPLEFRRKNYFKVGDVTATGQVLRESVAAEKVLEEAARRSDFAKKYATFSKSQHGRTRRGIGMSLFLHGAGFTGSGEAMIKGKAGLRLDPDGRITVLTACTDMGQGAHTVLPQMAADLLGVDLSCIGIETPDTSLVPNSGPTVASRTTMIMGVVLEKCANTLKQKLLPFAAEISGAKTTSISFSGESVVAGKKKIMGVKDLIQIYLEKNGPLTVIDHYELPPHIKWDDKTYKGDAYPAYAWGCDVAEVEVDMDTFEVRVVKMWMAQDIGRAINPKMAEGQIEGGTLQSVGYALMERHELDRGKFRTNKFQTYIIPTMLDAPQMETAIVEDPYSFGPMGAKGLGELPMDGGAPAIINAIANATGIYCVDLPATPERLFELSRHALLFERALRLT